MKIYRAKFGEVTVTDSDFPQVEVLINNEEGTTIFKGWLSPFRGYRFQVSGNDNGVGDFGSSPVIQYSRDLGSIDTCHIGRHLTRPGYYCG